MENAKISIVEKQAVKKRYETLKAKVFAAEQKNYSKLILYRSGIKWFKMGGNSALIYYHLLAKRMGVKPNLQSDRDFYSKFKTGTISFQDVELLIERLAKIDVPVLKRSQDMVVFDLGYEIEKTELENLKNAKNTKRERANSVLMVKNESPELWAEIRGMMKRAYQNFRVASIVDREFIENDIVKATKTMGIFYTNLCNGEIEWEDFCEEVRAKMLELKKLLTIAMELGVWDINHALKMTEMMQKVEEIIRRETAKRGKRRL